MSTPKKNSKHESIHFLKTNLNRIVDFLRCYFSRDDIAVMFSGMPLGYDFL